MKRLLPLCQWRTLFYYAFLQRFVARWIAFQPSIAKVINYEPKTTLSFYPFQKASLKTASEKNGQFLRRPHCLKITQIVSFEFFLILVIFVLLKLTRLVTLLDPNRIMKWDFFSDFQTPWRLLMHKRSTLIEFPKKAGRWRWSEHMFWKAC